MQMARTGFLEQERILRWSILLPLGVSAIIAGLWAAYLIAEFHVPHFFVGMVPSTAFLMVLSSLGIVLSVQRKLTRGIRPLAAVILGVSLTDLSLMVFFDGESIDHLLFQQRDVFHEVRMSPMTALCFVFAGVLLFLRQGAGRWLSLVFHTLGTFGFIVSVVALVGHAFGTEALYSIWIFKAMSVPTAFAFMWLFLGLMLAMPYSGWVWLLIGTQAGSRIVRRFGLPLMLVPVTLTFIGMQAVHGQLIGIEFLLSLIAVTMSAIILASLVLLADTQNLFDFERLSLIGDLHQTISDRDLLLREVYHRVKNNLQQINSLLYLQAEEVEDPAARHALQKISGRIVSLGTVQEMLLEAPSRFTLNARDFFAQLCRALENSLAGDGVNVSITSDVVDLTISQDAANTLGLIVNELVANSLRHGFSIPDRNSKGCIIVTLKVVGDTASLRVTDNGVGADNDPGTAGTGQGQVILNALVCQLHGEMEDDTSDGYVVTVNFPVDMIRKGSLDE